jgi:hypothetical protein
MKTTKPARSHASTHATHATHEGDTAMKTTPTTEAHASTDTTTPEGETPMKTQAKTTAPKTATTSTPATYVAACTALLDQFEEAFPKGDALTALDKKRTAKARKGSERYVPQLIALAKQHGVSLASVPLEGIASEAAEAQALVPLQKQMDRLNKRVGTRVFTAQSSSWSGATKLYAVLKRLSKDDGELAAGLQAVEQFFSHRRASKAKNQAQTKTSDVSTAAPPPTPAPTPTPAAVANGAAVVTNGAAHS